jgi:hypothetical protein
MRASSEASSGSTEPGPEAGVEFYIPEGCGPRGPVRNRMVHRRAFDCLPAHLAMTAW